MGVEEREDFQVCKCNQTLYRVVNKDLIIQRYCALKQHPVCLTSFSQSWRDLRKLFAFYTEGLRLWVTLAAANSWLCFELNNFLFRF